MITVHWSRRKGSSITNRMLASLYAYAGAFPYFNGVSLKSPHARVQFSLLSSIRRDLSVGCPVGVGRRALAREAQ